MRLDDSLRLGFETKLAGTVNRNTGLAFAFGRIMATGRQIGTLREASLDFD